MTSSREVHVLFFKSSLSLTLFLSPLSLSLSKFYALPLSFLSSLSRRSAYQQAARISVWEGSEKNLFYVRMGLLFVSSQFIHNFFSGGEIQLPFLLFPLDYITKKNFLFLNSIFVLSLQLLLGKKLKGIPLYWANSFCFLCVATRILNFRNY